MRDAFDLKISKSKNDKDFSSEIKKVLNKDRFYDVHRILLINRTPNLSKSSFYSLKT